jgi:glycerol transport system ATP-binding protein
VKLELQNISKKVGAEDHLHPLELTLTSGLNVLLGPTLAGKTSLLRLLAGLDKPTTGRVVLDGQDVTGVRVQKRSVAFVYQQFINYPSLTVFENIASPLRVRGGLSRAQLEERVQRAATMMRIERFLGRLPAELSGGQQQRTAIARALVKEADVLLMDEPLVNLDYKLREELRLEMRSIFSARDAIVVYATTEPYEALLLGGTVSVLDKGRLLQSGPTLKVYHRPSSQRVGEVFSDPPINLLGATVEGGQLRLESGVSFPLPRHMQALGPGPYHLGLRAGHAGLSPAQGEVAVPATVELAEISGSETFVHLGIPEVGQRQPTHVVAQLEGVHPFSVGQSVTLHLDPERLFAFDPGGQLRAAPARGDAAPA